MEEKSPKRTALKVAMMRAAHQIMDDPLVFSDPLALKLAGTEHVIKIKSNPELFDNGLNRNFRAFVTARSRFVEDELKDAYNKGVLQYVVLGAGFDTFAYRNPYPELMVFEIDFPANQKWKLDKLKESKIEIPKNLIFVPVDFETMNLEERLSEYGFIKDKPAIFSWLGVSMYLEKETMMETLGFISTLAEGSSIIFDYVVPVSSAGIIRKIIYLFLKRRLRILGEPWINFLDPSELKEELLNMGFNNTTDMGPEDINARFFSDRRDGLRVGQAGHIIKAEI